MKKHLCVVTWMGFGNYGTSLQSYALCRYLQTKGYDVDFVYRKRYADSLLRNILYKFLWSLGTFHFLLNLKASRKTGKEKALHLFNTTQYKCPLLFTSSDFRRFVDSVDVFVTGSDQIWNTYNCFDPFFFLDFAGDKRRIAYASSIGTNTIREDCVEQVKTLLDNFSCIGVREETAVSLLEGLMPTKKITKVLDPTFLLTAEEWKVFGGKANINMALPKRYIFCYLIGNRDSYPSQLKDVQMRYGIDDIVIVPSEENPEFMVEKAVAFTTAGPFEFVKLLLGATLVCTDSFHATAISINAKKNFVEFMRFDDNDRISQNSRINDILHHYNLSNRIYKRDASAWTTNIDFEESQTILSVDRSQSYNYLLNAIEN